MLKVLVFDTCEWCEGEAYVYAGEYKDEDEEHPVYLPCHVCKGSGEIEKPNSFYLLFLNKQFIIFRIGDDDARSKFQDST